ncbi:hypothetical protein BHF71_03265 [Vulcanibacillus modesticaldus]|uniref:Prepilin-type N-terminal cleavage/methylation domain-containing protein n=1 Tax=Vulcanibacillus modesticaldus TaxID=337097 RepID=A0A1D2YSR2_9BACI|nr:prepilin-type N-terminal cleavage/methylation domain-containing protein [Vulcanibacillus modesticaldus]OEF98054.1 hypothetical protein BHF71_03265 [Vulcanibacillus modesticaldus]
MEQKHEKGVTLIELLAAMTLLMVVLIPFTNLFFQGYKSNQENIKQLDTKIVATGIIEELKSGLRQNQLSVNIGGESFDISNPSSVKITNYPISLNGTDFILSFTIENYLIPDSMLSAIINTKPTNLYKISVSLAPKSDVINYKPINLSVIIKR